MTITTLPYWLVNVPSSQQPTTCPDFLINANAKDRGILSTPDAEYHRQTWSEVQHCISTTDALAVKSKFDLTLVRDQSH